MNVSTCPTQYMFFIRFSKFLLERVGREGRSDMALDLRILKIILKHLEFEFNDSSTDPARLRWVVILATYLLICFLGSLRGNEGFMVELGGLIQHIYDGTGETEEYPHVVIPLLGRFKNESGERWYLLL